jgi:hypothetical protein
MRLEPSVLVFLLSSSSSGLLPRGIAPVYGRARHGGSGIAHALFGLFQKRTRSTCTRVFTDSSDCIVTLHQPGKARLLSITTIILGRTAPLIAACVAILTYFYSGGALNAADVFAVVTVFQSMRLYVCPSLTVFLTVCVTPPPYNTFLDGSICTAHLLP